MRLHVRAYVQQGLQMLWVDLVCHKHEAHLTMWAGKHTLHADITHHVGGMAHPSIGRSADTVMVWNDP